MRVALITGGMSGLGESISTKMHAAGYRVVVAHSPGNTRVKDWLGEHSAAGRQFSAYGVDVADIDSCRECVDELEKFEDRFRDGITQGTQEAGARLKQQWASVLDKISTRRN